MRLVLDFNGDNFIKAQMLDVRNDCVNAIRELTSSGRQLTEYEVQDVRDFTETLHCATQILKYFCTPDEFDTLTA